MGEEDLSDNRLKTTTISHAFCALHHESFGFGLLDMILESELVIDMSLLTFYLVSYILTLNGDRKTCGERGNDMQQRVTGWNRPDKIKVNYHGAPGSDIL